MLLAPSHRHDQGQEGALDRGAGSVGPVLVGRSEGEPGDPVLGADQGVGALEEVGNLAERLRGVAVWDPQGPADVLGVDDDLT